MPTKKKKAGSVPRLDKKMKITLALVASIVVIGVGAYFLSNSFAGSSKITISTTRVATGNVYASGKVTQTNGAAIAGATVYVDLSFEPGYNGPDSRRITVKTNSSGVYKTGNICNTLWCSGMNYNTPKYAHAHWYGSRYYNPVVSPIVRYYH